MAAPLRHAGADEGTALALRTGQADVICSLSEYSGAVSPGGRRYPPCAPSTMGWNRDGRIPSSRAGEGRLPTGRSADRTPDPGVRAMPSPGRPWGPRSTPADLIRCMPAAGQEQRTMTAALPDSPVTEGAPSLEVRWIFPGQLETAMAEWFGRFPAELESREDAYLLNPDLRSMSVKVRAGRALEVKVYRSSPGILDVAGRARGHMQSWQKWSFRSARPAAAAVTRPAGGRCARGAEPPGSPWPAGRPRRAPRGRPRNRDARWNSPRSTRAARPGGRWGSR